MADLPTGIALVLVVSSIGLRWIVAAGLSSEEEKTAMAMAWALSQSAEHPKAVVVRLDEVTRFLGEVG